LFCQKTFKFWPNVHSTPQVIPSIDSVVVEVVVVAVVVFVVVDVLNIKGKSSEQRDCSESESIT
jgi:hypothetical protein